jgi:purine-binding chemotaxis protein CheW
VSSESRRSDSASAGHSGEYVTVTIRDQLFGLPINLVEDVFEPQMVTKVPLAPAEVVGVLNLRGRIVTVVDICAKLGIPHVAPEKPMAIGLRRDGGAFALLVDAVGDVIHPEESSLEPVPSHLDQAWKSVCTGVHQLEGKLMMVLDPACLFESEPEARVA